MAMYVQDSDWNLIEGEPKMNDEQKELCGWLKRKNLAFLQQALIKREYTLSIFKSLAVADFDDVIADLKESGEITTPQAIRFKAALKQLIITPSSTTQENIEELHSKAWNSTFTKSKKSKAFSIGTEHDVYDISQTIVLIGHARVGKSSIKDVLTGRQFNPYSSPTIRMKQEPECISTIISRPRDRRKSESELSDHNKDIKCEYKIWDTPGQNKLEHIPPLYMTGAMAILIVYDITDEVTWQRAQKWMNYVRDEAKGYDKVMVIGNKKDLEVKREVSYEQANNECISFGYSYMETSAKSALNIHHLQDWMNSHTKNKVQKNKDDNKPTNKGIDLESIILNPEREDEQKKRKNCFCSK